MLAGPLSSCRARQPLQPGVEPDPSAVRRPSVPRHRMRMDVGPTTPATAASPRHDVQRGHSRPSNRGTASSAANQASDAASPGRGRRGVPRGAAHLEPVHSAAIDAADVVEGAAGGSQVGDDVLIGNRGLDGVDVEVQRVEEASARRRVRARFFGHDGRCCSPQRIDEHKEIGAVAAAPATELGEVGQVSDAPTATRPRRVELLSPPAPRCPPSRSTVPATRSTAVSRHRR